MKARTVGFAMLALPVLLASQAQYPYLYHVDVAANVAHDQGTQLYHYVYSLANDQSSAGKIAGFEIDISRSEDIADLDTVGLRFENDGYTEKIFRRNFAKFAGRIVPVGFFRTPEGHWSGGNTNNLTASFDGIGESQILPGQTTSGFEITSKGLPGIRKYIVSPHFDVIALFPDPADTNITEHVPPEDSVRQVVKFRGWTVGPTGPLLGFTAGVFLDTLLSYVAQSKLFNWITTQSTADKYSNFFNSAKTALQTQNIASARTMLEHVLEDTNIDSSSTLTSEAYALLRYNTEYLLDHLPAGSVVSTYSLFATHSLWLEQNSNVYSGDIGVNEAGSAPFLDSQVELSVGIGTSTASGYSMKANRIKVKQGATVGSDVYYNELENNGTITGTLHSPLTLTLISTLPEFKTATPGSQNITIPQNGSQTLGPGSYGDILVRRNGKLTFTGGVYHLGSLNTGDNVQILFQAPSEVRIAGRFDTDQGTSVGPEDTTSLSANQIVFYIGGINGSNGNLGATPKAAQIGLSSTVKANFYVPNGTLWIRQNSKVTGAFIGKDVDVGIGVKVWLKSAF